MRKSYVYIMTNAYRSIFYIVVMSNLQKRVVDHINGVGSKFTKKYNLADIICFEEFALIE
ncbi:GIY-YIG nuclease family protein [Rasiella rasia]|uniref:GIY-YIG nuclease family protein n=1 Tax=Rasiella rasia TaxID=2744027 RepID=UPI00384B2A2D